MFGLGLSLKGLKKRAGYRYSVNIAAYLTSKPSDYELTGGLVSSLYDRSGKNNTLQQAVTTDQPVVSNGGITFSSGIECLTTSGASSLTQLLNSATANWELDVAFRLTSLPASQVLVGWSKVGDNNPLAYLGATSAGKLRLERRSSSGTLERVDFGVVAVNTDYYLTLSCVSGVTSGWLNGLQVLDSFNLTGAVGAITLDRFALGARVISSNSLPMVGTLYEVAVR
jgi:hypothetical protein